jgi:hypothetical protein
MEDNCIAKHLKDRQDAVIFLFLSILEAYATFSFLVEDDSQLKSFYLFG